MKILWRALCSNRNYSHICLVDTVYSLLVYIILIDPKMEKTFFILGQGIHVTIRNNIKNCLLLKAFPHRGNIFKKVFFAIWHYLCLSPFLKIFFKKRCLYYGHDHLYFSNLLGKKFNVIEDGMANYDPFILPAGYLFKVLVGIHKTMGYDNRAQKIYLSGIKKAPSPISHKVIKFNLYDSWKKLTTAEKNNIFITFNICLTPHQSIDTLLLTQPLSEDGLMNEKNKNEIYKKILTKMNIHKIVIKPHPREKTTIYDFDCIEISYINQYIPMELLIFAGLKINNAITLYSSSIFSLKQSNRLIYGTKEFTNKYQKLPLIEKKEFRKG